MESNNKIFINLFEVAMYISVGFFVLLCILLFFLTLGAVIVTAIFIGWRNMMFKLISYYSQFAESIKDLKEYFPEINWKNKLERAKEIKANRKARYKNTIKIEKVVK